MAIHPAPSPARSFDSETPSSRPISGTTLATGDPASPRANIAELTQPNVRLVHHLVQNVAARMPGAIAAEYDSTRLTYAQLNSRANQFARFLRRQGVGPDQLVAVALERDLNWLIALLGILKAGGAYVPLDLRYPAERLRFMLKDSSPAVLLARQSFREIASEHATCFVDVENVWADVDQMEDTDLDGGETEPHNLVYVIYTSGSTGVPKGVMVEHRNLENLVRWHCRAFDVREGRRTACLSAMGFDATVWELWPSLCAGATVVLASTSVTSSPESMLEWWAHQELDVSFLSTPIAELALRLNRLNPHLRTLLVGGDTLRQRPDRTSFQLVNNYGPTETTVVATSGVIVNDGTTLHIGQPITNAHIYILSADLQPLPVGEIGEIYIGGAGVARGYLNHPELTAERFGRDPFSREPRARMYRTGDLARWRSDGNIEFLGRNDDQVKVRGNRIELREIEEHLGRHTAVAGAIVVARELAGEKRLVAYVTVAGSPAPSAADLRAFLKTLLPDYMIPSAFVTLDGFPLNANGKIDRQALPEPGLAAFATERYEPPLGEMEEILSGIWQESLQIARVGRQDGFFELGGHSLLVVDMLERLRRVGLSVDVRTVYENPTLMELASKIATAIPEIEVPPNRIPPACTDITPGMLPLVELDDEQLRRVARTVPGGMSNIQDVYPLTPLQEGMLFHHLLDADKGDTYVVPTVLEVASRERVDELMKAIQTVINRHDILRTAVLWENLPRPVQVVYRHVDLPVTEVAWDSDRSLADQINDWIRPERQQLNLWQAPLARVEVATDQSRGKWYVLLQIHHIVDDAISLKILIAEVVAQLEGRAQVLTEPVPFRTHVARTVIQSQSDDAEAFFHRELSDVNEPTAPFGLVDVREAGGRIDEVHDQLEDSLAIQVRSRARSLGVSVATLFHAAWALVIARASGRNDVVFGTVLLGRMLAGSDARRIVGMFVNTLPLRARLEEVTARDLVDQMRWKLVEMLTHEQASLVLAQRCSAIQGSAPLFSAVLNFRHSAPDPQAEWSGASGVKVAAFQYRTNFPLTVSVDDLGSGFALTAQADRQVDPRRVVDYLQTALRSLLDALEREPEARALDLEVLPAAERQLVTRTFNQTVVPYPCEKLLHQLFEQQAELTPGVPAVVYGGDSISYAELNARANQLARHLRARGVGPDQLVGVCVERGLDMVVSLLGILKAGGAYLPLDPVYPAARLTALLKDAAPKLVLLQQHLRERVVSEAESIMLDADWPQIGGLSESNLTPREVGVTAGHLAYVIYTSGSTGRPKGVMVEHRNVISLWQGLEAIYSRSRPCSRVGVNASFNFDASVKQIIQLLSGRTLVLIPQETRLDAPKLLTFMDAHRVEGIDCTPSQLRSWISEGLLQQVARSLRLVLIGGEPIDRELWEKLARCPAIDFYNVYGPTESTVDATVAALSGDLTAPHIGRPMENRQIYILDARGRALPIGVHGEIHIGGAGVARGYLNAPEQTAERFVTDPFSGATPARMYKTGDLGRWRSDGTLEYLGRNDDQVKIRGYRIELGEIESILLQEPHIRQAAVLARDDDGADKRLVAYVAVDAPKETPAQDTDAEEISEELVSQWKRVHDETYSAGSSGPTFVGWTSSYSGEPISPSEMQEWLDATVSRIRALQPKKVLEIGCGVGLLLQHIAPGCDLYVGADFSGTAIGNLCDWIRGRSGYEHVELLTRAATDLQDLPVAGFDTVILNSVVQYFPDVDYLVRVLEQVVRLVKPGGHVFIGDVRNLGLLPTFHAAVQLSRAAATIKASQLKKRSSRALMTEKELVLDPEFFLVLAQRMPGVAGVNVELKRGHAANELTRYRYDVVLQVGDRMRAAVVLDETLDWEASIESTGALEAALKQRRWTAARLSAIPNARLAADLAANDLIEAADEHVEASTLRRQVKQREGEGVEPEALWQLGEAHGYDVHLGWDPRGPAGSMEALLLRREHRQLRQPGQSPRSNPARSWRSYANEPLESSKRQRVVPALREYLRSRVPEYMVPSAWVVLRQLPLSPNGKVDRRALPAPQGRAEESGDYIPPGTEVEHALAEMWAQILQIDQVGLRDNFFEIGGHSLLAMQVIVRVRSSLSIALPMSAIFDYPTVAQLAAHVELLRQAQLLEDLDGDGSELRDLLGRVESMPQEEVDALLRKHTVGASP